ncbi:alpha/beta fold hydrolase [Kribbella italica]|uniref:Pimeloyl-ACP methyl ester carboxylesterase n=1 Tax=Kribbella italica TaxID=1540520 RepID=A0A7W9J350_9ACTN|nr:alpha/beta hydrolase [Kribbella italica]MBB5834776.1 pimeloyl-ACP methyl ester carboxylesterase [Kribbella italica]
MAATHFDVGGYKLAAEITGDGTPTVVFSSGSGDAGEAWVATIAALTGPARLVTYARAGVGASEALPDPTPRSFGAAADELRRLLDATGIPGPYILVGHSIGAVIAQVFAARWSDTLAGLVLVDPSDVRLWLDTEMPKLVVADGDREDHASFDVKLGAEEAIASQRHLGAPSVVVSSRVGRWLDSKTPHLWKPFTLEALDERWQRTHSELAAVLGGKRVIAQVGGHYVQNDEPELVAGAIGEVIHSGEATRSTEV